MRASLLWLSHTDMEEVSHNLGILNVRALAHGLVARAWFHNTLKKETCIDQQIQPLTYGSRESGDLEIRQTCPCLWRGSTKKPFSNVSLEVLKVPANLDSIRKTFFVTQVTAVGCVKAGMSNGELQKATWL